MLVLATQTPVQSVLAAPNGARDLVETGESPATQRVAAALDTVLPPALVDLVLSPLVVLEILMRTVMDGGARVIGPLTLLAGCAFAMFAYDRSSRRKPKWVRNRSEVQR